MADQGKQLTMRDVEAVVGAPTELPIGVTDEFRAMMEEAGDVMTFSGNVPLIQDKDRLLGIPFAVKGWKCVGGDFGVNYAHVRVILPNLMEVGFNDGGTAILPLLEDWGREYGYLPTVNEEGVEVTPFDVPEGQSIKFEGTFRTRIRCVNGLRRSDYKTEIEGRTIDASTYRF